METMIAESTRIYYRGDMATWKTWELSPAHTLINGAGFMTLSLMMAATFWDYQRSW